MRTELYTFKDRVYFLLTDIRDSKWSIGPIRWLIDKIRYSRLFEEYWNDY